ncbi:MAG: hypothetical protein HRT71_19275 [Flavobacteriales bacterium]|nr:hypothetical protein [Flavobacteriales bacterium]
MKIIADSGSTKCDWAIVNEQVRVDTSTMGLNPFFHDESIIYDTVKSDVELSKHCADIKEVFFYGAGCSSDKLKSVVKVGLQSFFKNAEITVGHDAMSSVLATYTGEPCVSCILGTGSNSIYFDGKDTREEIPALGYIMGDEGSGSYFGKQLLKDFLYRDLPNNLASELQEQYKLDKKAILARVLTEPNANVYLASFMPFLNQNNKTDYVQELIARGFNDFLKRHVLCYKEAHEVPIHYVGSVAFYFKDELQKAMDLLDLKMGNIVQKPIDGLARYHE